MGNAQNQAYSKVAEAYSKYYPKSNYLRPAYVSTAIMISGIGNQVFMPKKYSPSNFRSFVFLASTGANLGLQIWVSFVSGMTMIRILPRQDFSLVQSHLFPKYFFLNTFFSCASFYTFLKYNPINTWQDDIKILGFLLGGSFILNAFNFAFLNIKTADYSLQMREIEKVAGDSTNVVGSLSSESKIEKDPAYKKAKKTFYVFHGILMLTNLASMISNIAELYILSSRDFFSFN